MTLSYVFAIKFNYFVGIGKPFIFDIVTSRIMLFTLITKRGCVRALDSINLFKFT